MDEPEWIAERIIWAVDQNGQGFDIGLRIGRPYQTDSPHGDWACPVAMIGLHRRFPDIYGVDSWQALVLAVDLTKKLLETFVEIDGGKLYHEKDGLEGTVDEIFGIPYKTPEEDPVADGPLSPKQQDRVAQLRDDELMAIDAAILRNCSTQFRKIARVVGYAIIELNATIPNVSDIFYADRVRHLIEDGELESQGRIDAMRFGEVKLAE
jgi:hypothetical protein